MNKALLIGNVTRDPEIKTVNGKSIASFSIATSRKYKDQDSGEKKEIVEYHNLTAWGRLAEIVGQYVKKGNKLYIEGEIRTRMYEKDGVKHYPTSITVMEMEMLTPKNAGSGTGARHPDGTPAHGLPDAASYSSDNTGEPPEIRVEDIPF